MKRWPSDDMEKVEELHRTISATTGVPMEDPSSFASRKDYRKHVRKLTRGMKFVLDTKNVESLGKFVNSPFQDPLAREANAGLMPAGFHYELVALEPIRPGEEILADYGEGFFGQDEEDKGEESFSLAQDQRIESMDLDLTEEQKVDVLKRIDNLLDTQTHLLPEQITANMIGPPLTAAAVLLPPESPTVFEVEEDRAGKTKKRGRQEEEEREEEEERAEKVARVKEREEEERAEKVARVKKRLARVPSISDEEPIPGEQRFTPGTGQKVEEILQDHENKRKRAREEDDMPMLPPPAMVPPPCGPNEIWSPLDRKCVPRQVAPLPVPVTLPPPPKVPEQPSFKRQTMMPREEEDDEELDILGDTPPVPLHDEDVDLAALLEGSAAYSASPINYDELAALLGQEKAELVALLGGENASPVASPMEESSEDAPLGQQVLPPPVASPMEESSEDVPLGQHVPRSMSHEDSKCYLLLWPLQWRKAVKMSH
jgi:hypothetical protein